MSDRGFWIEPAILTGAECEALLASIRTRSAQAGTRHLMSNSAVAAAARDERMLAIARKGVGQSAVPFRATLFEKTGEKNWLIAWHQDTALPLDAKFDAAGWGPWSEKAGVLYAHAPAEALQRVIALRLSLDDSTDHNGPLRVVPDSHRLGVLPDAEILALANRGTAETCTASRGGVIVMRPLAIHASSKAMVDRPRRVLHIEYADSLQLGPARLRIS